MIDGDEAGPRDCQGTDTGETWGCGACPGDDEDEGIVNVVRELDDVVLGVMLMNQCIGPCKIGFANVMKRRARCWMHINRQRPNRYVVSAQHAAPLKLAVNTMNASNKVDHAWHASKWPRAVCEYTCARHVEQVQDRTLIS
jgi:hypothetical protein